MLLIRKTYFDAIRSGAKTTTLRYWCRKQVLPGSMHKVRGLGVVQIDEVKCVEEDSLTHHDALSDGFESLDKLKESLREMYPPNKRKDRKLYRIRFRFLGERQGKTPSGAPSRSL